jgi:hypothetical protein
MRLWRERDNYKHTQRYVGWCVMVFYYVLLMLQASPVAADLVPPSAQLPSRRYDQNVGSFPPKKAGRIQWREWQTPRNRNKMLGSLTGPAMGKLGFHSAFVKLCLQHSCCYCLPGAWPEGSLVRDHRTKYQQYPEVVDTNKLIQPLVGRGSETDQ